jgi:predicted GNAT superfamily acetyltransferase
MKSEQEISVRPFEKESDYFVFEALQKETWGKNIEEVVTGSLAKIIQKIGGIAAGAFDAEGEMVGFVFGFTGFKDGRPVHWSHMLAVKPAYRDTGIGRGLKLYQRDVLLGKGINEVFWTYDPLAGKNGHLNLNTLGAEVVEYVQDMYGSGEDSILFRGIGTDRFIVVWQISDERVKEIVERRRCFESKPFLASPLSVSRAVENDPASFPVSKLDLSDKRMRVEVPHDVHQLMSISIASAADWRKKTREAFQQYLHQGYKVMGFYLDQDSGRCFYCLERPS